MCRSASHSKFPSWPLWERAYPFQRHLEFEMTFAIHAKEARREIPRGSSERLLSRFQINLQRGRYLLVPLGIDIKASGKEIASRILQTEPPVFFAHARQYSYHHSSETGLPGVGYRIQKMADETNLLGIKTKLHKKSLTSNESPTNDFSQTKRSSKKHWVRNAARRSWINDFENATAAFG